MILKCNAHHHHRQQQQPIIEKTWRHKVKNNEQKHQDLFSQNYKQISQNKRAANL